MTLPVPSVLENVQEYLDRNPQPDSDALFVVTGTSIFHLNTSKDHGSVVQECGCVLTLHDTQVDQTMRSMAHCNHRKTQSTWPKA